MINNRQAGRRRGRGGGNNGQRPGGGAQGNGSRIDNRARGNASQLYEKYKNMAADAQRAGDRVNTEYYLQFADHYFRVLSEQRGRFEDQQQARRQRDDMDFDGDEEFGDEGEPARGRDGWSEGGEAREERPREDRQPREDRPQRDERPREDRQREFRREDGEGRRNGNGDGRREWQERPRERRPVEAQGEPRAESNGESRVEVGGQRRADAVAPSESLPERAEEVLNADRPLDAPAPRRRGRPRRDDAQAEPLGFELPPSIGAAPAVAANDEEPAAKPRRRRTRPVDEAPAAE